ncbi:MAG: CPBP family glutamic-type intramembrane protease, partial [Acidimicrobiales bacterium]
MDTDSGRPAAGPKGGDPAGQPTWGLGEAVLGFVSGFLLATLAVGVWSSTNHLRVHNASVPETMGTVVAGLLGLWVGLLGGPLLATHQKGSGSLRTDFGLSIKPWPDVPIGVVAGLVSQYVLLTLFYLPLRPLVPHLNQRLSQPAHQLTGGATGTGLVVVALLVCVGAPLVEEIFFRGLLLRALDK